MYSCLHYGHTVNVLSVVSGTCLFADCWEVVCAFVVGWCLGHVITGCKFIGLMGNVHLYVCISIMCI
jgi:hypothetical protein